MSLYLIGVSYTQYWELDLIKVDLDVPNVLYTNTFPHTLAVYLFLITKIFSV